MILCVDPDPSSREATVDAVEAAGFDARACDSVEEASDLLDGGAPVDGVVAEYDLSDGTGLDLFRLVREKAPDAACVLFTATPLDAVDTAAFGDIVAEYLSKDGSGAREELAALLDHSLAFGNQTSYPLPENEEARLAALSRYATDEAALDDALGRLTEIATALFDVDSAAVGLVDAHHERFLSCQGISLDTLDREDTVCTYAILDDGVTVIEDVEADPRFTDNEALRGTPIRFYAGAPIRAPGGEQIGVFCLFDDAPGTFSDRERHLLSLLADEAMDQLELRGRAQALDGDADE